MNFRSYSHPCWRRRRTEIQVWDTQNFQNRAPGPSVQHGIDFLIEKIMSSPGEITLRRDRSADERRFGNSQRAAYCGSSSKKSSLWVEQSDMKATQPRSPNSTLMSIRMPRTLFIRRDTHHACAAGCDLSMHSDARGCEAIAKN